MKIMEQPTGLEGYVVLVHENDMKTPLDLPELKGEWVNNWFIHKTWWKDN